MFDSRTNFLLILLIIFKCDVSANNSSLISSENIEETLIEDFLLCRSCGTDTALTNFVITKLSDKYLAASNDTIFGKRKIIVQLVENPLKDTFEIIILKKAHCANIGGSWKSPYSWFEGYAWKLCLCPKCSAHLGWMFEPIETALTSQILPTDKGFFALDVSGVIAETDLKSILVTQYKQEL